MKVSPSASLGLNKRKIYDINVRSVEASFANGIGHSGLKQLCADFNLHPLLESQVSKASPSSFHYLQI